jgi:hypothetical protein
LRPAEGGDEEAKMTHSKRSRIYRLFKELRVHERFRALAASLHKDREPPPELATEMPPEQFVELLRRCDVYDGVNTGLAGHLEVTAERLKTVRALLLVAHMRRRWGSAVLLTRAYLAAFCPEPILSATAAQRRREAEDDLLSLEDLALWNGSENFEAHHRELEEAVASGALKAQQAGDQVLIALGDYCRWAKEEVPIGPEFGFLLDVRPDSERDDVEQHLRRRTELLEALAGSPEPWSWCEQQDYLARQQARLGFEVSSGDTVQRLDPVSKEECTLSEAVRKLVVSLYQHLQAIEQAIDDANEAYLPGGDIAHPRTREMLTRESEELAQLYAEAVSVLPIPPFDLPEPGEEELSLMWHLVHVRSPTLLREEKWTCPFCRPR